jgi:hypothetical protein
MEENHSLFIDGVHNEQELEWEKQWNNVDQYREKYEHPLWERFMKDAINSGHGGMDWMTMETFFESVRRKLPFPIDVYDMATWMSITTLSEQSIAMGGAPISIPDFTNGQWIHRTPIDPAQFILEIDKK